MDRGAVVLVALLGMTAPVSAQDAAAVVQPWYNCVAASYLKNRKVTHDPSAAVEMAFSACATEESVVRIYAAGNGVPSTQAEMIIITHKARMKRGYIENTTPARR